MATVNYNGTPVSDKHLRVILQSVADNLNQDLRITSGDRDKVLDIGGKKKSLHLQHRAADLHANGLTDAQVFVELKAKMNSIFDHTQAYEVIRHGPFTGTHGAHIHIGHYGEGKAAAVYFKKEGWTPDQKDKYQVEIVKFGNPNGVSVPQVLIRGSHVDASILSTGIGVISSVGEGGKNIPPDVYLVQTLLNQSQRKLKSAKVNFQGFPALTENSVCDSATITAINIFQRDIMKMNPPDGRVDPGGRTIRTLYVTAYNTPDKIIHRTHRINTVPPVNNSVNGGGADWNGILAWGAHPSVNDDFNKKVVRICRELGIKNPSWLMAIMAQETGDTFSPSVPNRAGSSGTGLIQFMRDTIDGTKGKPGLGQRLGIKHSQLKNMTALRQLDIVKAYFEDWGSKPAQAQNVSDLYFLVLNPKGFGKSDDYALFTKGTDAYNKNNMDYNNDGKVSVAEVSGVVRQKLDTGLSKFPKKMQ